MSSPEYKGKSTCLSAKDICSLAIWSPILIGVAIGSSTSTVTLAEDNWAFGMLTLMSSNATRSTLSSLPSQVSTS